jgi:hypothetical protein
MIRNHMALMRPTIKPRTWPKPSEATPQEPESSDRPADR